MTHTVSQLSWLHGLLLVFALVGLPAHSFAQEAGDGGPPIDTVEAEDGVGDGDPADPVDPVDIDPADDGSGDDAVGEGGADGTGNETAEGDGSGDTETDSGGDEIGDAFAAMAEALAEASEEDEDDDRKLKIARPLMSLWKFPIFLILYLSWVTTCDWINRSSQLHRLDYMKWNSIAFFPFVVLTLASFVLPFFIGISLLAVNYFGVLIAYTAVHNKKVNEDEKVFTGDFWRRFTARTGNSVGLKMQVEKTPEYEKGPQVDIKTTAGDEQTRNANLVKARQSPGYIMTKELVAEMADNRVERALLDYTQNGVAVKHYIDGVWHAREAREREPSDVMLAVMKQLANLNPAERRAKQQNKFKVVYKGSKYTLAMSAQGVQTGERVLVNLIPDKVETLKTYPELGMRDKLSDVWSEMMGGDDGLLIFSAMPEGGLTTLVDVSFRETDRLMRDFVAIEDVNADEFDVENVEVIPFDSKRGQTPAELLPTILRKYPNVIVARDFNDEESAKELIAQVPEGRLVITQTHARSAAEALLRMLQKKVPRKAFSEHVTGVLCTRLIRKLCEKCKIAYEPSPDLLQKLGIPAGKVTTLYRIPKPEDEIEKPCEECCGIGYKGRCGLFELLVVNDKVREVLRKQPKLELLQRAARGANMRTFQEEAILLVAKGVTTLEEAMRVLK